MSRIPTVIVEQSIKAVRCLKWLPASWIGSLTGENRQSFRGGHVIIAVADHFEPSIVPTAPRGRATQDEQERRVENWCQEYPNTVDRWRDSDGHPFKHTYFFPAEQYEASIVDRLADHAHQGWGELEIHFHHGYDEPDTADNTKHAIETFRDALVERGCLSQWDGAGPARYAFVHGDWALANSARGRFCGVDSEMAILAETGCYADMTLPSAPEVSQTSKVNSLYECTLPLEEKRSHRRGRNLEVGRAPTVFPLMVQGPLSLSFERDRGWPRPRIENGAVTTDRPATLKRLRNWIKFGGRVKFRDDWIFVKLHCHGMDPNDRDGMLGEPMVRFLQGISEVLPHWGLSVHFTTAREMVNILLAACDGRNGNPGDFRDYRLRLFKASRA